VIILMDRKAEAKARSGAVRCWTVLDWTVLGGRCMVILVGSMWELWKGVSGNDDESAEGCGIDDEKTGGGDEMGGWGG
jgi:hypothetical protein